MAINEYIDQTAYMSPFPFMLASTDNNKKHYSDREYECTG